MHILLGIGPAATLRPRHGVCQGRRRGSRRGSARTPAGTVSANDRRDPRLGSPTRDPGCPARAGALWLAGRDRERWLHHDPSGIVRAARVSGRKYPSAGRERAWHWLFPVTRIYRDRLTGQRRRHHLHESVLQLRHSLATHLPRPEPRTRRRPEPGRPHVRVVRGRAAPAGASARIRCAISQPIPERSRLPDRPQAEESKRADGHQTPRRAVGIGRPASQRLPKYADRPIPSPNCS
jgi:hypothetical protein